MKTFERDYSKLEKFSSCFAILNDCISLQQEHATRTLLKAAIRKDFSKTEIEDFQKFLKSNLNRKLDKLEVHSNILLLYIRSNKIKETK